MQVPCPGKAGLGDGLRAVLAARTQSRKEKQFRTSQTLLLHSYHGNWRTFPEHRIYSELL
jgi:hypothetical protein